jgi:hypothetical protein
MVNVGVQVKDLAVINGSASPQGNDAMISGLASPAQDHV